MTDRELLELAAKAAGICWEPAETDVGKQGELKFGLWLKINHEPTEYTRRRFNPLTDDGDAFRLAVKLGISIEYVGDEDGKIIGATVNGHQLEVVDATDPCAATRRAIVRAAAELAKQEKS